MNIPNTYRAADDGDMPVPTPARSQAASKEAPAGFHKVALALEGSGASAPILRGQMTRFRLRRVRLVLERMAAVHDEVGVIKSRREKLLVALEFQCVRHHLLGVRQHAVGGHDDVSVNP